MSQLNIDITHPAHLSVHKKPDRFRFSFFFFSLLQSHCRQQKYDQLITRQTSKNAKQQQQQKIDVSLREALKS